MSMRFGGTTRRVVDRDDSDCLSWHVRLGGDLVQLRWGEPSQVTEVPRTDIVVWALR